MSLLAKRAYSCALVLVLLGCFSCWYGRELILLNLGRFLVVEEDPVKSDVIVLLRGDRNYSRALEAARLYKEGYSPCVYISSALEDRNIDILEKHGVKLPSEQERLKAILVQSGIQGENILAGHREPGGGSEGEVKRIKAMMLELGFARAIIVTNWWHTKRTNKICHRVFAGTDIESLVVAARNDISNPSNWWKYRYEAIRVLEEFPKLVIHYLFPSSNLGFDDDPKNVAKEKP